MNPTQPSASLFDLVDAIDGYARTQFELLQCLRELRAELRQTVPTTVNGNLPLTPIITSFVSAIEPSDKSVHLRASACPPASTGTAATSHSLISPRRDYDYFSDLDQKLARLEARLAEGRPPGPQHSRDILEPTRTLSAVDERVRHIRKVSILEIPNA